MSTAVNHETSMPGGEGREIVHPDGSLTRVAEGAITTLAAGVSASADDGSAGVVRLSQGALWHQPNVDAAAGQAFAVEIGSARIVTEDATFAVIVEPDGSCFLTSIVGTISVHGAGSPFPVAPLEATMLSPAGELLDSIQATPDEVRSDPWVGTNLTLSGIDPADVRVPEYQPPRFEPRPPPDLETTPAEAAAVAEAVAEDAEVADATPVQSGWVMAAPVVDDTTVVEPTPETEAEPASEEAAAVDVDDQPAADAPEIIVPSAVLEGREETPADIEAEEESEEEERQGSRLRVGVAVALVLVGLVVVVIAGARLINGGSDSDNLASTDTTASTAKTTTTTAGGSTTTKVPASTTPQSGGRYTVYPTRCAQTGSQLSAEGNLTNLDTTAHSYRISVVFTTLDDAGVAKQAASANTEVKDVAPNQPVNWKATTTYSNDLSSTQGGCKVGSVEIINGK